MNVGQASVVSQMSITDLPLPPSSLLLLPCFSYSLKSLTPQLSSVISSLQELCPNLSNCQLLDLVSFSFILVPSSVVLLAAMPSHGGTCSGARSERVPSESSYLACPPASQWEPPAPAPRSPVLTGLL